MMRRMFFCSYPVLCCLLTTCSSYLAVPPSALAGVKVLETVTSEQAQEHIGEINTVCGLVASARYVDTDPARPTFLNFDRPYPNQSCAVRIPDSSRAAFNEPVLCKNSFASRGQLLHMIVIEKPTQ
jgi:hypothetical protein